jgi:hypothetical protein
LAFPVFATGGRGAASAGKYRAQCDETHEAASTAILVKHETFGVSFYFIGTELARSPSSP